MIRQSFEEQLEHLVLFHLEVVSVPAREHAPRVFVVGQLVPASTVVGIGEVGTRTVSIAIIVDVHVAITPETRTIVTVTAYQAVILLGHKLLPHVQREEEGPAPAVVDVLSIAVGCPGVVGVAADGFPELGADEHEGVLLVVALLVEGLGAEAVL